MISRTKDLILLYIHADDYPADLSWRLVNWCQQHGTDEWTITRLSSRRDEDNLADRFDAVMGDFERESAIREHVSTYAGEELVRTAELWQFSAEAITAHQEFLPDGLFTYAVGQDDWIEDPTFYRRGELILGVVAHEYESLLRVTEAERQELVSAGFPMQTDRN